MGTDIHLKVQRRQTYTINDLLTGKASTRSYWKTIDPPEWWEYDDYTREEIERLEERYATTKNADTLRRLVRERQDWYSGRNYNLFAILADVRNGYGFAGISTGSGWANPVAPHRGLPEGEEEYDSENRWLGDHSHTWMTLEELLAYDWDGEVSTLTGVVFLDAFTPGEPPACYAVSVHGPNTVTVPESAVDGLAVAEGTRVYVRQEWQRTAAEAAGDFYRVVLPGLKRLADESSTPYEDIRLVMGFDS